MEKVEEKKQFKNYNMKCNSAVKYPVEYKKTVEYNLGKKENFAFQQKNSRANTVEYIPAEKRWNPTEQALITISHDFMDWLSSCYLFLPKTLL